MILSAPKRVTFIIAVVITVVGMLASVVQLGFLTRSTNYFVMLNVKIL